MKKYTVVYTVYNRAGNIVCSEYITLRKNESIQQALHRKKIENVWFIFPGHIESI